MEQINNDSLLLELIDRPVLCVKEGIIVQMNRPAAQMQISNGTQIRELLSGDFEAYANFTEGQLYLTIFVADIPCGAAVVRTRDMDYFILDQESDHSKLQAMALAAQQLRVPLANVMTLTDTLIADQALSAQSKLHDQAMQINKGLFQLLRVIANMADAHRYAGPELPCMETVDLAAFIDEIFEKANTLTSETGIQLKYTGLGRPVFGIASKEYLERGIYNLISNAVKFSPKGAAVEARLTQIGSLLSLSIQDYGRGIAPEVRGNLFARFHRQPGIEDGRYGIGLGMTMVRSAAAVHGGTVLVDQPQNTGTRVTMTIAIRQDTSGTVRSPIRLLHDYAGGWDHALVELSEALPSDTYGQ